MLIHEKCPECRGNGWVPKRRILVGTRSQVFEEDCPTCNGTGVVDHDLNDDVDED